MHTEPHADTHTEALALICTPKRRTPPEPAADQLLLSSVLGALADPVRLTIVQFIAENEERPCKACACPKIPKSTLAHHFKVLRRAGVIRSKEIGTELRNSLRRDDLNARFPGLLDAVLGSVEAVAIATTEL
jgi:DNA-binding transcriptional ArsR family regulator